MYQMYTYKIQLVYYLTWTDSANRTQAVFMRFKIDQYIMHLLGKKVTFAVSHYNSFKQF